MKNMCCFVAVCWQVSFAARIGESVVGRGDVHGCVEGGCTQKFTGFKAETLIRI